MKEVLCWHCGKSCSKSQNAGEGRLITRGSNNSVCVLTDRVLDPLVQVCYNEPFPLSSSSTLIWVSWHSMTPLLSFLQSFSSDTFKSYDNIIACPEEFFLSEVFFWPKNALFFILDRLLSKHSYLRSWYESKTATNFPLLTSLYCMCGLMFSKVIHSNVCCSLCSVNSHCRQTFTVY